LSAQKQLSCSHLGLPKYRIPPGQEALILVSAAAESYFNKLLEANRAAIVLLPSSVQRFCNGVVIGQLVSISVADEPIVLGLHHPHRQMTCRLRRYCSASSSGRSCLCNYRSSLATHKPMRRRSRIHLSEINGRSFSGLRRTSTGQSSPLIARQRRPDHL